MAMVSRLYTLSAAYYDTTYWYTYEEVSPEKAHAVKVPVVFETNGSGRL